MTPVDQTTFGATDGNCFSACVASILELPIERVPFFMQDDDWAHRFAQWLKPLGFYPITFKVDSAKCEDWHPQGLYILGGKSPRGEHGHGVVARGTEIVHDPHPTRAGLETWEDATLIVPFEPRLLPAATFGGAS